MDLRTLISAVLAAMPTAPEAPTLSAWLAGSASENQIGLLHPCVTTVPRGEFAAAHAAGAAVWYATEAQRRRYGGKLALLAAGNVAGNVERARQLLDAFNADQRKAA